MKDSLYNGNHNISGERIRIARERKGLSQVQLAAKLQTDGLTFTNNSVSQVERNQRHLRDFELKHIAKHLDVSADWILGEGNL